MKSYICTICGYVYKPEENDNVEFESLSDDWVCPMCLASKDNFVEVS